jgi:hypothetical protein
MSIISVYLLVVFEPCRFLIAILSAEQKLNSQNKIVSRHNNYAIRAVHGRSLSCGKD